MVATNEKPLHDQVALVTGAGRRIGKAMFRALEKRFGRLDVLVNNAGVFFPRPWNELTEKDWDHILGINLKGAFFCAQAAARLMMRQRSGNIINISSLGGLQAWPGYLLV